MTKSGSDDSGDGRKEELPLRDWILLPFLSLLTIFCILGAISVTARLMYFSQTAGNCLVDDPVTGVRGIPNCVSWDKNPETSLIDYRFNSRGHRAGMEWGEKAPGVYRIAMAGSSIGFGSGVFREQSFAAILPAELSRRTGRKVELYNESAAISSPHPASWLAEELLATKPDLILWLLTPLDVAMWPLEFHGRPSLSVRSKIRESDAGNAGSGPGERAGALGRIWKLAKARMSKASLSDEALTQHSISSLTMHFLYESQSLYVKSYLTRGGLDAGADISGSLKSELSSEWQGRLKAFDGYAADVEKRAKAANVPVVAVLIPMRAQIAMISMGESPAGYDPYKLDNELRAIISRHGGTYVDILPYYRNIPNPERDYFPIFAHPDAKGHQIISELLAQELTGGAAPALGSRLKQQSMTEGRSLE